MVDINENVPCAKIRKGNTTENSVNFFDEYPNLQEFYQMSPLQKLIVL